MKAYLLEPPALMREIENRIREHYQLLMEEKSNEDHESESGT